MSVVSAAAMGAAASASDPPIVPMAPIRHATADFLIFFTGLPFLGAQARVGGFASAATLHQGIGSRVTTGAAGLRAHEYDTTKQGRNGSLRSAPVSVHEATTGKVLGTTELPGLDDSCPMFVTFGGDRQTKSYDAPPSIDELIDFVIPSVQS
jgi:hypothetical protein